MSTNLTDRCGTLRRAARSAAAAMAVVLAMAAPASAATLLDEFFAFGADTVACYARVYDAAHLKAHPRQRVTTFFVRTGGVAGSAGGGAGSPGANRDGQTVFRPGAEKAEGPPAAADPGSREGALDVAFGFTLRDDPDAYSGMASCAASGEVAVCVVEGDGGSFRLERHRDGRLRVVIDEALALEGETGFSPDLAVGGDDSPILLTPEPPPRCGLG